ncbi:MAG: transporter [Opitutaceae bacterium]|nr:transporter [Opitutaceae bacterium]
MISPAFRPRFLACSVCAAFACNPPASAAAPAAGKGHYSWSHPTPDTLRRELSTDRPDVTESPFTVDAGRVQLEMDLANYTRDRLDGVRTTEWGVAPFNLRFGVRNTVEAGIFFAPWIRQVEEPLGGSKTAVSGCGDMVVRGKWNFRGNDDGGTAYGLIADVKLPTAARGLGNGRVEGAVALPVAGELAAGWKWGAMTQIRWAHDDAAGGCQPVWFNSITCGRALVGAVAGYVELTSLAGEGSHVGTFDVGLTWQTSRDTQLDAGVNLGISRPAPDALIFSGLARRF